MLVKLKKFLQIEDEKYFKSVLLILSVLLVVGFTSIFFRHSMSWFDEQIHYSKVVAY